MTTTKPALVKVGEGLYRIGSATIARFPWDLTSREAQRNAKKNPWLVRLPDRLWANRTHERRFHTRAEAIAWALNPS